MSDNEREVKYKITTDASSAVAGTAQTAQGFDRAAQSMGKAADEAERYQKALEAMAAKQGAAQGKTVSSEDQAVMDKAAERKKELADRKKLAADADKEIAAGVKTVTQAEIEAATKTKEAEGEAFTSKAQLKAAVKGLKEEFPLLAHVAHMALNPITASVALAGAAWEIWKSRVDALSNSLAGFVMPEIGSSQLDPVREATKAWESYSIAVADTVTKYGEAEAASKRMLEQLRAETTQRLALNTAMKNYATARLEAEKTNLPEGEYAKRKAAVDTDFNGAERDIKWQSKQDEWYAKNERNVSLQQEAEAKEKAARQIKVGEAGDYARVEADYKKTAEAAEAKLKESREFQGELRELKAGEGSIWKRTQTAWKGGQAMGYGFGTPLGKADPNVDVLIGREANTQEEAQRAIDNYQRFEMAQRAREQARQERNRLTQGAATARGAAFVGQQELVEEAGALAKSHSEDMKNAVLEDLAAAYRALAEIKDQANKISKEVQAAVDSGNKVMEANLIKLRELVAAQAEYEARIRSLENTRKDHPPGT